MVRLGWVVSTLLVIATAVGWAWHYETIMQRGTWYLKGFVPVLGGLTLILLFITRRYAVTNVREPKDPSPTLLLLNSGLLFMMTYSSLSQLN